MNAVASALPPALDSFLALAEPYAPRSAAAAGESLQAILAGFGELSDAWSGSALGRTGFPVEIDFLTSARALRYTAEVAGPEVAPGDRLGLALALAGRLAGLAEGAPALDPELRDLLRGETARLRYGARLGGRHREKGERADAYEVDVEIPSETRGAEAWASRLLGSPAVLSHRRAELSRVGLGYGRTELHYSARGLHPGEIATAMGRVGLEARALEVFDLLQEAYGRSFHGELPSPDLGWSYALRPNARLEGEGESFTLWISANALLGGDGRIRAALLRLAAAHGWDLGFYEELSRPLAESRSPRTHHGRLGIVAPTAGPLAVRFGLTPPLPAQLALPPAALVLDHPALLRREESPAPLP
jgi:hypothetical protein